LPTKWHAYPLFTPTPAHHQAVWTWAYALHDLLYTQGVNVATLTASKDGSAKLFDTLVKQDFYGASGRVYFDPVSGNRRGLPIKIENSVDGEEMLVGHFSPESGIKWDSSKPLVWHASTFLGNGGDKNNGTNYADTGDAFAPSDGRDVRIVPLVYSVVPSVITTKGGKVVINGRDFFPGIITVLIADKICVAPVFKSNTLIECNVPPGVGGPHKVVVNCNGVSSKPHKLLSYFLPQITRISRSWVADGSRLLVTGNFFVEKSTRCRIEGFSESLAAAVIDDSHIECDISFSKRKAKLDRVGTLEKLEVSNDGGGRWVSGVTLNTPIVWGGGTVIPVAPRTIHHPKEVVIGGTVATDRYSDPETQKQYYKDMSLAFAMAESAINAADYFPGDIQLRVEVLSVDPEVSGTTTTANKVLTAFAKKGVATNATNAGPHTNVIGIAGPMWSSNSIVVAREVSTPFRLPMVSYDAWSSVLDNATEFPYFVRVGPANSDVSRVCAAFMRSMGWMNIAVVTDDDAFTNDFGQTVVDDMKENGATVLYHGVFPMVHHGGRRRCERANTS
jgi:ABC-type branched-subunit amino acid transport system substrate-binding protein